MIAKRKQGRGRPSTPPKQARDLAPGRILVLLPREKPSARTATPSKFPTRPQLPLRAATHDANPSRRQAGRGCTAAGRAPSSSKHAGAPAGGVQQCGAPPPRRQPLPPRALRPAPRRRQAHQVRAVPCAPAHRRQGGFFLFFARSLTQARGFLFLQLPRVRGLTGGPRAMGRAATGRVRTEGFRPRSGQVVADG